ncbi:hypothetical protein CMUS01_16639 [Colletotrichum musicola]|uniref:Uncharacterized protein n=1 Tax=Colletotrichum musicola TaxID=2175873 RepID=A0A8H6IM57_9PEZI|nr:hypothetical protein CMUS01_16639 [Colletotrichum musicola]
MQTALDITGRPSRACKRGAALGDSQVWTHVAIPGRKAAADRDTGPLAKRLPATRSLGVRLPPHAIFIAIAVYLFASDQLSP